jgi:hypothetical protein
MITGGTFHFRYNPAKLEELLVLRRRGWSYGVLAIIYECPKTTIRFMVRKHELASDMVKPVLKLKTVRDTLPESEPHTTRKVPELPSTVETINEGKTYAQYLQEEQERKRAKLGYGYSSFKRERA